MRPDKTAIATACFVAAFGLFLLAQLCYGQDTTEFRISKIAENQYRIDFRVNPDRLWVATGTILRSKDDAKVVIEKVKKELEIKHAVPIESEVVK
jgi:uncharacterized protein YegP (UPF0339 family)